jgi:hypothetical protein
MPIVTLMVKMSLHPKYSWSMLGFDVAFIGIAFDAWAILTLAAQRRVMGGGYFDLPETKEQRDDFAMHEGLFITIITGAHYVCAGFFSKMASPPGPDWRWTAAGVAVSLVLPYAMIDGAFLPKELKGAA